MAVVVKVSEPAIVARERKVNKRLLVRCQIFSQVPVDVTVAVEASAKSVVVVVAVDPKHQ